LLAEIGARQGASLFFGATTMPMILNDEGLAEVALRRDAQIKVIREAYDLIEEAEFCRKSGDLRKARAICEDLTKRYPGYWAAQHTLGLIYSDLNLETQSLDCFLRAAQLNPRNILSLTGLAGAYLALDFLDMARGVLDQARKIAQDDPGLVFLCGELFFARHQYREAADSYRSALAFDPTMASAAYKWGLCLLELGDRAAAARLFEQSLEVDPSAFGPLSELAGLPPELVTFDVRARLEDSKGSALVPEAAAYASLSFAKASACRLRGLHEEAWKHAVAANRAAYPSRAAQAKSISEAQNFSLLALHASGNGPIERTPSDPHLPTTLLVLGCSRSGKTTVESLLGNWGKVQKGYESHLIEGCLRRTMMDGGLLMPGSLDLLPKQLYEPFKQNYFSALTSDNEAASVFTNTNPFLISEAVHIIKIIPNVRIVCIKRDIDDTVLSIYMRDYRTANEYAYDLNDIRAHVLWYHEMIDALAIRCPDVVQVIEYEELVTGPARILSSIASGCGLDDSLAGMAVIKVYDGRGTARPYLDAMRLESDKGRTAS
jgi:tetratricopeptide (TPR) repeat protein